MNRYLTITYRMPQEYCENLELLSTAFGVSPGVYNKILMMNHIDEQMKNPGNIFKQIQERVEP